jgi:hypothetical protein
VSQSIILFGVSVLLSTRQSCCPEWVAAVHSLHITTSSWVNVRNFNIKANSAHITSNKGGGSALKACMMAYFMSRWLSMSSSPKFLLDGTPILFVFTSV